MDHLDHIHGEHTHDHDHEHSPTHPLPLFGPGIPLYWGR